MISAPCVERLLGGRRAASAVAAVVLHQELDVGRIEFGERHLGGVAHGLPGNAGIAAGRQRQNEADLDLAGAERRPGGSVRARWRRT